MHESLVAKAMGFWGLRTWLKVTRKRRVQIRLKALNILTLLFLVTFNHVLKPLIALATSDSCINIFHMEEVKDGPLP